MRQRILDSMFWSDSGKQGNAGGYWALLGGVG
jgi:hypothetical protein